MNKSALARAVSCACLLAIGLPTTLTAAPDWKPELVEPAQGARGPSDPIRLKVPALVLPRVAVELDGFDVTQMVTQEGGFIVFIPPQPLPFGEHELRVVEYAENGDIIERGVWRLQIRKSAAFREAQLQSSINLNGTRRIADDDLPKPEPKRDNLNGSAQFQGAVADGDWRAAGQMDLIYNSREALMPRGVNHGNVDMGQFLLTAESGPVVAQAGHHNIGPDSLIMQGFGRRGVSAGLRSAETGSAVTAFAMRTSSITGFHEGFGIGDSNDRTDGIVVSGRPIASNRDALALAATYLSGEGPDQAGGIGSGVAGDTTRTRGSASGLVADGNMLEKRMRLRGEYAVTRFDFDGDGRDTNLDGTIDSNLPSESDHAYSALVTYTPWRDKVVDNQPLAWNLGLENKRVGTFFRSPANPGGIADRKSLRGFTDVTWGGFIAQASLGHETDNVEDLDLLPRIETMQSVLALMYTPQINQQPGPDGQLPPLPWYGQPSFNAMLIDMDQDVEKSSAGLSTGKLNSLSSAQVGATFSYQTWSWSLSHTLGKQTDFRNQSPDTRSRMTQLNANFRVGEKLTIGPNVQYTKTEESDPPTGFTAKDTTTTTGGLNLGYLFTERVSASLGFNYNRTEATDNSQNNKSIDYIGSLNWAVARAEGMRPGLNVSLEGQYRDFEDQVFTTSTLSHYQIFLKLGASWMPSY